MNGEQLYNKFRYNLADNGARIKCWKDISNVEKAAWEDTADEIIESHDLVLETDRITRKGF
jgi:hypothetical protein